MSARLYASPCLVLARYQNSLRQLLRALRLPSCLPHANRMSKRKSSQSRPSRTNMSFFGSRSTGGSSDLVSFYEGNGRDFRGRSLANILRWNASKLESSHDYIQTVFPLPEGSGVNWDAPIIDRRVFDAFRSRPELRAKLRESFQKILWFYGLNLEKEGDVFKVVKGGNYEQHKENWDSRFDHNHLRITRIIRCLRVLGLEQEALAFHSALEENFQYVSSRSREYWRRAAERGLNIRPDLEIDDEDDDTIGPKFLREYEQERKKKGAEAEAEKDKATAELISNSATETNDKEIATDAAQDSNTTAEDISVNGVEDTVAGEDEKVTGEEENKSAGITKIADAEPQAIADEISDPKEVVKSI